MTIRHLFRGSQLARAAHNQRSTEIELGVLAGAGAPPDIATTAKAFLDESRTAIDEHDVDGAWHFLNEARRSMMPLQSHEALSELAAVLRVESRKLSKWRRHAIESLLPESAPVSCSALTEALRIRDDAYETRYHRIRLLRGQLKILSIMSILALTVAIVLVATTPVALPQWDQWSWRLLLMTLIFGVLGACISSARSITPGALKTDIPELVASGPIAVARIVLGAAPGLIAYVFLQSGLVTVGSGRAGALTVAFVGGFSERLIVRVAESIAGGEKQADDDKTKPAE